MELETVRTLYPARTRNAWLCAAAVLFVLGGLELGGAAGWSTAGFFGFCAIVLGVSLLPGSGRLEITREGIAVRTLFLDAAYRWSEIEHFQPRWVRRLGWIVTFDCTADVERRSGLRRLSRAVCGYELALPDTYGLPGRELAVQLESCRRHAVDAPGG